MRHLTFLRVYVPLEQLPPRIHGLARAATKLSRTDIEAEAAERLNRRLRPDTFRLAPSDTEPPIIRVIEAPDPGGTVHQLFHVEYLTRAAFESAQMRRKYYDDTLYEQLVPQRTLATLEKISELQADAGLISRPVPNFHMKLWTISLAWLAAFGGTTRDHEINTVTESIVGGTPIIRRTRDLQAAASRLSEVHRRLAFYGPDLQAHPYCQQVGSFLYWLNRHRSQAPVQGVIELDYGALSRYAWPDTAGAFLERGFTVLERAYQEDEAIQDDDESLFPGLPPAMLNQAAETMRAHYQKAVDIWERIQRYECAN